jgi:hypothetical protein
MRNLPYFVKTFLTLSFCKRPTNAQGSSGCFINTLQILPQNVSKYDCHPQGVVTFHNNWSHKMSHNPHTPITQNTAWVAYRTLTTPWEWQPSTETRRGRIWNVLIKNPPLPWAFVGLFTNDTTRYSVQPSRFLTLIYIGITKHICIRSSTITDTITREKRDILAMPRTLTIYDTIWYDMIYIYIYIYCNLVDSRWQ